MFNPEDEGTAMLRNICNIPEDLNFQGYYLSNLYYTTVVGFYFSLVFHLLIDKLLLMILPALNG